VQRLRKSLLRSKGPTERNALRFLRELKTAYEHPLILVIGGGEIGNGAQALYADPNVTVVGTDIYKSELTQFVSDGHQLPLADASVHGVWIQAVLEHVLTPSDVVAEIHRVLVPYGLVYAETPFMQQVHEGAYDFTRFTPSGHRWLFRWFEEIESGITRGPGSVLIWSLRYFFAGLLNSGRLGLVAAMSFFWLKYFDRLMRRPHAYDGPTGSFFLGRRSSRPVRPIEMVSYYRGAQKAG
jgi:SAM-dependent methyltransferase